MSLLNVNAYESTIEGMVNSSLIFAHSHQPAMRGLFPYERPPTEPGESTGDGKFGPIRVRRGPFKDTLVHNHTDQASGECYLLICHNLDYIVTGWSPPLLMQLGDPITAHNREVFEKVRETGRKQKGNILAELFSHPIAPLLSNENLEIQLDWSIEFYKYMFGYSPKSMWFAESAVNSRVLKAASERGIENTILAPWQVSGFENTFKPYKLILEGREMNVVLFDPISTPYSFEDWVTMNAEEFLKMQLRLLENANATGNILMVIASDTEFYNHHKPDRHMFIDKYLELLQQQDSKIQLITNLESYIQAHKPTKGVTLNENTAWSLEHKTESWERGGPENWKADVRKAINDYDVEFWILFYEKGKKIFRDPLGAAKSYIKLILDPGNLEPLKSEMENPTDENIGKAMYLLDAMTFVQFMHTSCALFFEWPGLETEGAFKAAYFSLLSLIKSGLYNENELDNLKNKFLEPLNQSKLRIIPPSRTFADDFRRVVGYHDINLDPFIGNKEYIRRTGLHMPQLLHFH